MHGQLYRLVPIMQKIRTRLARLTRVTHRESLRFQQVNEGTIRRGPRAAAGESSFPSHMTFSLDELLKGRLESLSRACGIAKGTLARDAIDLYCSLAEKELEDLADIPTRLVTRAKE